jgi:hypothetical protein
MGTVIPSVLVSLAYIPRCLAASTGVPVSAFYRDAWVRPSIACLPFALSGLVLERYSPAASLAGFFAQVALTLPLVAAGALAICLTPEERRRIAAWVRERRP